MREKIKLSVPDVSEAEIDAVVRVLNSGWYTNGPENDKLEERFKVLTNSKYALSVNSCTSALELAIKANNITGEVIIPAFTWVSTANCVATSGATPVFCDVDPISKCVTAEFIERVITSDTAAVIVVHYGGATAEMDEISKLCEAKNIILIEDCAETIGGYYNRKPTGSFGIGCFSFFPTKNLTTGEGGMLTSNDKNFHAKAKQISAHGLITSTYEREDLKLKPWERIAVQPGHNYRLSNILAAMGVVQFDKLEAMNSRRRSLAEYYDSKLCEIPEVHVERRSSHVTYTHQMYTVTVDPKHRDNLVMFMRENDIEASVHFSPSVHQHPAYRVRPDLVRTSLEHSEKLSETIITLPMHTKLTHEEIDQVVNTISRYFQT